VSWRDFVEFVGIVQSLGYGCICFKWFGSNRFSKISCKLGRNNWKGDV